MTKTYKEDLIYFLGDYKFGKDNQTAEQAADKMIEKLRYNIESIRKEPGMCSRTLNKAIEVLS